jgi:hypothetical protein
MKTAKYRNVGIKHLLINTEDTNHRISFTDIHMMVKYVIDNGITITNTDQLPVYYQQKLIQ